jgi:hypothetical protein
VTKKSGHYIQLDQPELVIDSIREVGEAARQLALRFLRPESPRDQHQPDNDEQHGHAKAHHGVSIRRVSGRIQTADIRLADEVLNLQAPRIIQAIPIGAGNGDRAFAQRAVGHELIFRLAEIGNAVAADIDTDPIARGLEAIASGYSLRYPEDKENLARQFDVYDSLYAWCRLQVAKEL